jgi:monoamine oxidase
MALLDPNVSLWVATTPKTSYPQLRGNHDADVVVVGGGITGLTTALLLAQGGVSVVVVEAHRWARGRRVTPRRRWPRCTR